MRGPGSPHSARGGLGAIRFSAVELLVALVLLFVATPFLEGLGDGELIETVLMSLVLVAAVMAVGGRRRMLLLTSTLMVLAVLGRWLLHFRPHLFHPAIALGMAAAFLILIIVNLLRFVLRTPRVNGEVLCASISAYLLLGLLWSLAYRMVVSFHPGAFAFNATQDQSMQGYNAFYFSFVTLSTVGYGDITPVSSVARMLAVMESMTGTLYVAVLIARLVALYSTTEPTPPSPKPDQSAP